MRLESFRVRNCFGFINSGEVNLKDQNNFIYILGRNSSGKSSFLNALRYFQKGIVPKEQRNFQNFNKTQEWSGFIGKFSVENGDLSSDPFATDLATLFVTFGANRTDVVTYSDTIQNAIKEISAIYQTFMEELAKQGTIQVAKNSDGTYLFSLSGDWEDYKPREQAVNTLLQSQFGQQRPVNYAGTNYIINGSFEPIESLLFNQFPRIFLFNQAYSLQDDLPERITLNLLADAGKQNALLKAFVAYLGPEMLNKFLKSDDYEEIEDLLSQMRQRVKSLIDKVNSYDVGAKNNEKLLEMVLHEKNGLQITVETDQKKSFYSHLSDNTKFLFAYNLFKEFHNISGDILLFDEPNNGFHPSAQEFLLAFLQSLATQNLVVVSTHSEHLIDLDHLSGVRIMTTDKNKITVRNYFYSKGKGTGDYLALQPVLDAIGLRYGQQINLSDRVIITEGITDLLYHPQSASTSDCPRDLL